VSAPPITFADERLAVRFDRFDADAYDLFLRLKRLPEQSVEFDPETEAYTVSAPARFAKLLGVDRPPPARAALPLADYLFDDQRHIVGTALDAKRFAVWSDCGLGKTAVGLEFGRQVCHRTGGRVLVVTFAEIVGQWQTEAAGFYGDALPVVRLKTREEVKEWCRSGAVGGVPTEAKVAVTNYEKFNHEDESDQVVTELRLLAGLILDESSRLKTGGGKQKWAIIKSGKGIEYKLSLTATPAPNELMEFASQASFLETMRSDSEIIWTYFARDNKTHRWTIKPHAKRAFFEFMSSWSIYVQNPKRFGWRLDLPDVPEPEYVRVDIEPTAGQLAEAQTILTAARAGETPDLFAHRETNTIERMKLSQLAKGFLYHKPLAADGTKLPRGVKRVESHKPAVVARIAADELARGSRVVTWTVFDGESNLLREHFDRAGLPYEVLTGDTPEAERVATLDRFRRGECPHLVTRAALLGFGQNFQFVRAMILSGWTDSYEAFYQLVHRAVRHGQTERVRIYLPCVRELEDETLANLDRKARQMAGAIGEMEANYVRVLNGGA
jgi:superfamily II DNA or RNA helicase